MCGITGFFCPAGFDAGKAARIVSDMTQRIQKRGPDAQSHWCEAETGVALGHARLSVIETSESGAQPMNSASGRFFVVFNGEIYNHMGLREELAARNGPSSYRGHSDTESLLAGFEVWGVEETLKRVIGMFAFVLWDRQERQLHLGRDRFGEKPLYYGWQGGDGTASLLFGSELKSLHAHPAFEKRLSFESAAQFFERHCVPGTASIFEGINKVAPGTILTFDARSKEPRQTVFWSLENAITQGADNRFIGDSGALLERTDEILSRAVKRQMLSDVPLGAFLSGGVDSSTIVSQMQRFSSAPVKTFTIGFSEEEFDESSYAEDVARFLGTDHTALTVTTQEAQAVIPDLCKIYDEPFADSSQIPTYILSQLAREQVTVSLTGDGADELFAGYSRYGKTLKAWQIRSMLPGGAWSVLAPLGRALERATSRSPGLSQFNRAGRVAGLFGASDISNYYASASNFARFHQMMQQRPQAAQSLAAPVAQSDLELLGEYDIRTYMPDDILVKVDRAAMAASLETRAPFLDHEVAEFAFSLPPVMKRYLRDGRIAPKWPLRQLLYQSVPETLIERPKKGFGVPIGRWLRGNLKDWADSYLLDPRLGEDGLLDAKVIQGLWTDHKEGISDNGAFLWAVLMFCSWREKWL